MFRWTAFLVFAALICVASSSFAQSNATMPGNYVLGGSMSWTSVDTEGATERVNTWTLAPRAMYFMVENLAVGTEVGFVGTTVGDFGAAVHRYFAVAQYVFPTSGTFRPYGEAGGGFSRMSIADPAGDISFNGWGVKAAIGAHMFINEHLSITPEFAYFFETFSEDGLSTKGDDQTIFLGLGISGWVLP